LVKLSAAGAPSWAARQRLLPPGLLHCLPRHQRRGSCCCCCCCCRCCCCCCPCYCRCSFGLRLQPAGTLQQQLQLRPTAPTLPL